MKTEIINIGLLVYASQPQEPLRGKDLAVLPCIVIAYIQIECGLIVRFGPMDEYAGWNENVTDAQGCFLLTTWCDSHTHLVFAASREEEFVDKIKGLSYAEIAAKGGGILNSARKLNDATEEELFQQAWKRLQEIIRSGTGAVEIKSGYGLTVESELKMLRVIDRLKKKAPIPIKATFLGAHTYPLEYRDNHAGY